MDILEQLKDAAYKEAAFIGDRSVCSDYLPKSYQNYDFMSVTFPKLYPRRNESPKARVSLILSKQSTNVINAYTAKLPIMTLNVRRWKYTIEAFEQKYDTGYIKLATDFMIESDICQVKNERLPNKRFSDLLHILQSTGYEDYFIRLGTYLKMNVDIVKIPNVSYRYTNKHYLGFITALHVDGEWFAQSTQSSIC